MRISDWSSDVCSSDLPKGTDGKVLHPISASALKPVAAQFNADGKPFNMGMVFPVSTHNYELRYWLAAGGLKPGFYTEGDVSGTVGADVKLSVTPPPQMPEPIEAAPIESRPEERRVGNEGVSSCELPWSPNNVKTNTANNTKQT